MTTQETINKAVAWALSIANSPDHGYDQTYRWGPNYDCSSFIISAWEAAGVPVKEAGATYTGNMLSSFLKCGFRNVLSLVNVSTGKGLQKGDVLLNTVHHTEMYIGDGKDVKASINERGGTTGGQSGDQTGSEICVSNYYNYPWNYVLRYYGGEQDNGQKDDQDDFHDEPTFTLSFHYLRRGDGMGNKFWMKPEVKSMQILLNGNKCSVGIYGADGEFGPNTEEALKAFQRRNDLDPDGVYGPETAKKLNGLG